MLDLHVEVDWPNQRLIIQDMIRGALRMTVVCPDQFRITGENKMALVMTDIQKATLHIQPVDLKGNPAPVENVIWSVVDGTILSLVPAAGGLSAEILAIGPLGATQVNVQCDAQIGAGITALAGLLDVSITNSQATTLAITADTPINQ